MGFMGELQNGLEERKDRDAKDARDPPGILVAVASGDEGEKRSNSECGVFGLSEEVMNRFMANGGADKRCPVVGGVFAGGNVP
ncbi:hypothetical protein HPP92_007726 [Vanilla planifolia]|uniref:Uncharacterized protein n=1 Tax=Vanilla planifolia TaxID=51239 RepID=A0A835V6A8_VANPL|nr:hypothetical protein HPP92_007865 [Vanilla planifolia]KAG0490863.1 hypothetical protein HPP92_007726 [Vanilla planifolia]